MESRRDQLLDAALDYCVNHGLANLSLRPLSRHLGTSARMLLFHFESKEGLIAAVLGELNQRLQVSFKEISARARAHDQPPLRLFWEWAASRENLGALRLLYELQIVAVQNPGQYARFQKKISLNWQAAARAVVSEPLATLCIAVFDG